KGAPVIDGIVAENKIYKPKIVQQVAKELRVWRPVFHKADLRIAIGGSQALFAYYLEPTYALEAIGGLTDATLAHLPVEHESSPAGHRRPASIAYMRQRRVDIHLHSANLPGRTDYNVLLYNKFPGEMRIIIYENEKMQFLKSIRGFQFIDFSWYLDQYMKRIGTKSKQQIRDDYQEFKAYYFNYNRDHRALLFKKYINAAD
ncbi:MAG: hypothetical protein KDK39_16820, partial [Leptospiraceae bacterium]|nr:hypothetical protein [Leptospiraceae bacterium]